MTARNNQPAVKILSALILLGVVVWLVHSSHTRHRARPAPRRFAQVHHLQNGGYCYQDGQSWWYYDIAFGDSGGVYSPTANTWEQSAKSPAANNLQINAAKDASEPEEVEITAQGQPENAAVTEAEVAELDAQVSDMVNEGNPNSQDMADTDGGSAEPAGGGDAGGNSGGDSGGGDSGGGGDGGGD